VAVSGRVLVTGGAGFVGVNLGRLLSEQGFRTRCFDDFSTGHRRDAAHGGYEEVVTGDVRDLDALTAAARGCDYVVHLAAQCGVPASLADPLRDHDVNVRGTLNALLAARDIKAAGFVLASSSAPLGDVDPPAHEGLVPHPKSPYGASKLAGEGYCSSFAHSFGLSTVALRFTNVYGPYSYHKGSVVASFCRQAQAGEPLVVFGDGTQTRDFIYVDDLCKGIAAAMTSGAAGVVAHLGSGVETTVLTVADEIRKRFGDRVSTEFHPTRTGDIERTFADISFARQTFGFSPQTSLTDGLDRTVRWFEGHM
jgi:UDP-glucose 4-epimerase